MPNPSSTVPMIICPTTHNDWDWQETFEGYYSQQTQSQNSVSGILDNVTTIFAGGDQDFRFSYAEIGFLRRYLHENPDKIYTLQQARGHFCLLGGGITSPDNQVSHGEVFIRNYLTGHEYLRSMGLLENLFFVAWLPDDFGHDPQLPVLIEALGMKAIALSRIPGSPQPTPCYHKQVEAANVRASGLAFYWPGSDGSTMLTHFMPATYYGITNYLQGNAMQTAQEIQSGIQQFLDKNYDGVVWPGGTIFATEGGDWQFPVTSAEPTTITGAYNWADVNDVAISSSSGDVTASCQLGTFEDYYNALMESASDIPSFTLYAENYWTGYFASRPQLKIDHYQATQLLLGAEVLGSILAVYAGTTPEELRNLSDAIAAGWHLLVPTTHHDFITGTSPDSLYIMNSDCEGQPCANQVWDSCGQLSMSTQAVNLAEEAMKIAMAQLAKAAAATPKSGETAVVVFNQIGRDLPDTALVEMADPSGGTIDYQVRVGSLMGPVQRSSENTLLFQVPDMRSMAYKVVYLVPQGPATPPPDSTTETEDYTFSNDGVVSLVLSQDNGWAITKMTVGSQTQSYVQDDGTYANRLEMWNDGGNIYQFGMEFILAGSSSQVVDCETGAFAFDRFLIAGNGSLVEDGPVRWRFIGNLTDNSTGNAYTTQYDLIKGETLVRITTAGAVTSGASSLLTSFPMQTTTGDTGSVLEYGTSYFWENRAPQQSWDGLNFRASHDFAQLVTSEGDAVAAVYHNGIPAWTIDGSTLRGCLLRNTPGGNRGGKGSDTCPHTQHYTLDINAQRAETGYPLRTSLYTQTPLYAELVNMNYVETMREAAQLAHVIQKNAVLRVGKMNPPSEHSDRSLILRVQQMCTETQELDIHLPFLASGGTIVWPSIVTALENISDNAPSVTLSENTASFQANRALWTMKVPITLPTTRVEEEQATDRNI